LAPAFFGRADIDHRHPVGLAIELVPVGLELRVGGEEVVVADARAKLLVGRRDG
jgi:hypothetical protein